MSNLRKIFGTSVMSLLLVIWGLFMVCSGRVPQVNNGDDFSDDEFYTDSKQGEQSQNSDLMNQLAGLDDDSTSLEEFQRREILEALGIDASQKNSTNTDKSTGQYLNEEMFLDLEVEIADLEKEARKKDQTLDSLKMEMQESDIQLAALDKVVEAPATAYAFNDRTAPIYNPANLNSNSEYSQMYQDAMNSVYARQYPQAITRFQDLLRLPNSENLADNCQYWIGECYYALGNYEMAIAEFEKVFAFNKNNKVDDAQFMIGMSYVKIGEKNMAQMELLNLVSFFQNSEYISRAENKISDLRI